MTVSHSSNDDLHVYYAHDPRRRIFKPDDFVEQPACTYCGEGPQYVRRHQFQKSVREDCGHVHGEVHELWYCKHCGCPNGVVVQPEYMGVPSGPSRVLEPAYFRDEYSRVKTPADRAGGWPLPF